jgi:hypothetical protein
MAANSAPCATEAIIITIIITIIIISLCTETKRVWNMNCITVPKVIGATGMVTKALKKFKGHTRKTFNRFATKGSHTWNITHNMESIPV